MDETGLYWQKLLSRTYISREEKSAPGLKASKDRHTLLLGGSASGTLKSKPLLVYHSETPRVIKGILKSRLPVIWTSNRKPCLATSTVHFYYTRVIQKISSVCEYGRCSAADKMVLMRAEIVDSVARQGRNLQTFERCSRIVLFL